MDKRLKQFIDKYHPCKEAVEWLKGKKFEPIKILDQLIAENKLDWANWFIVRIMNREQRIKYAIFAAEQVLYIYEEKYPDDNRVRKAIDNAKKCLINPNKDAAAWLVVSAWVAAWAVSATDAAYDTTLLKILDYGKALITNKN